MVFGHLPLIKWNTHPTFHFKLLLEIGEGGLKRTLPCGPWFLVRIQRRIWGFTCGKNKFIKERIGMSRMNRKNTSRERWVKPRQALALEDELRGFSRQGFYIFMHVVQHRLRVLIQRISFKQTETKNWVQVDYTGDDSWKHKWRCRDSETEKGEKSMNTVICGPLMILLHRKRPLASNLLETLRHCLKCSSWGPTGGQGENGVYSQSFPPPCLQPPIPTVNISWRCTLLCRVHHEKHWTGRNTSWNQDCREKYQ